MTHLELDPWLEGYLSYQRDVRRMAHRTVIDVRCTLKKVSSEIQRPIDTPLWKLRLEDYLQWINSAREAGRSESALAKDLSHIRGMLDYAWRSGRADRNVLDGFTLKDSLRKKEPRSLTLEEASPGQRVSATNGSRAARPTRRPAALRLRVTHRGALQSGRA